MTPIESQLLSIQIPGLSVVRCNVTLHPQASVKVCTSLHALICEVLVRTLTGKINQIIEYMMLSYTIYEPLLKGAGWAYNQQRY